MICPQQPSTSHARNPLVFGNVRFTVITPHCVRLEYAPSGEFTDEPTLFAINREARTEDFQVTQDGETVTISTPYLRLQYVADGQAFHAGNLMAWIRRHTEEVLWTPGMANAGNLGGPLSTLDGVDGPRPLPHGLLSTDGWYLVDDSGAHVLREDWIAQGAVDKRTDWYLFGYGDDYQAALKALAVISGPAPLPRKQIFGSWYCRWWDYTSQDYRDLAQEYTDHNYPLDIMVMDMGWHRYDAHYGYQHAGNIGWTGFSWNRQLLPDIEDLLAEFRQQGISTVLNVHPHDGIRDHEDCYPEFMTALGHDPATKKNLPFLAGDQQYMDAYFAYGHAPHEAIGVDFWWVDWQQDYIMPYVWGLPWLRHLPWLNFLYYRHTARDGQRGMSFSRWAGWGDHRHPIQFSGDCKSNWEVLTFLVPFTAVSGNVGCFYWAHDLGGFFGERNAELYARWVQFGVTSACLRLHSCGPEELDRRPWKWDAATEASLHASFALRAQLIPYIYSTAYQAYAETLPLLRPMYLQYPRHAAAYQHPQQFLFGDHLIVAPITTPGEGEDQVAQQSIWLPEGVWYHWFTGKRYVGEQEYLLKEGLNSWPLFVRAGAPIPLQPDTLRMTTTPLTHLRVRCHLDTEATTAQFALYEDDGQSQGYLQGEHAVTPLSCQWDGTRGCISIGATQGTFAGQPSERRVTLELYCPGARVSACRNGQALPVSGNAETGLFEIALPAGAISQAIMCEISAIPEKE
ncbi:MAG TPA: TIM-barrel domain-containing protein [Armatimonadota bacterium]|jgi:alpha-glucosidase (family GH31 glycosyl hydrolase)